MAAVSAHLPLDHCSQNGIECIEVLRMPSMLNHSEGFIVAPQSVLQVRSNTPTVPFYIPVPVPYGPFPP